MQSNCVSIGVLGHVDSGKTSLCRALSTKLSTAALDKHPQSVQRGITIDLGFSAYTHNNTTFTLVDCPGHASLIKTVIGGAQIIDAMILVIDAVKGFQTQTAECIVIGEILAKSLIVVINKIDLLINNKAKSIESIIQNTRKTMKKTIFGENVRIACVSATSDPPNVSELVQLLDEIAPDAIKARQDRDELPFLYLIDHCFPIKGQGTVITGTVLQGRAKVGDELELSAKNEIRKIKSMQMFHDPVGICLTQFDSQLIERGWAFKPGSLKEFNFAIVSAKRIRFYKHEIKSKSKFHISIGHHTVLASVFLFKGDLHGSEEKADFSNDHEYVEDLTEDHDGIFAILEFERPVLAPINSLFIASNLCMDTTTKSCRMHFLGIFWKRVHVRHLKN
jgi:selenocysteine-specific elongation factor